MDTQAIALPQTKSKVLEYSLIATAFLIPMFISGPQLLTGGIVNALLFLFVLRTKSKNTIPLVVAPSIGAVFNGLLFGTFTPYLLFFLPFIWVGNYIMTYSFRLLLQTHSILLSIVVSSIFKSALLFTVALLFTRLTIVPALFLQFMGVFQLLTALLGGLLAFGIHAGISKKK